ncbi:Ig-like domain-containing protein [uncultured Eubacterium sp.]|uniref:Ig-like domain-containing protein n=1 Tax=uncultured Eubacterium sp. TaxID=165185 RepID=UPI002597849E|nr:Ig-like domain-containing protein [uncultured Eubacterium sp.]
MKTRKRILSIIMAIALVIGSPYVENMAFAANDATINKPIEVLFIGNSLTHRNSMPAIFEGISEANGVDVNTTMLAFSSYYLSYFADPTNDYGKQLRQLLEKNSYDFVVVQAQSSEALSMYETSTIPSATTLANLIRNNGAEPVMYMTWAYKNQCSYEQDGKTITTDNATMTEKLSEAYYRMGNELGAKVAPAGQNFKRYKDLFPNEELYNEDEKHPTYLGSYLAACTIYNTIFSDYQFSDNEEENIAKQSCIGCPYYKSEELPNIKINKEKAEHCQMISDVTMSANAPYVSIPFKGTGRFFASVDASNSNDLYKELCPNGDKITFSTLDNSIVSIDKTTGKFKANKVGTTLIKATSESGVSICQTVNVRMPASGVSFNEDKSSMHVGETKKINATVLPANATDKSLTWTSSNTSIATVNNGTVTALTPGTVTITARTHNGYSAQTTITISLTTPTNLTLKHTKSSKGGAYINITASWNSVAKAEKYIVYRSTSSNGKYKKVATVSNTTYTDSNLKRGSKYFYKVYASCGVLAYRSAESSIASYLVPLKTKIASAARTKNKTYIKLNWNEQSNANGYLIYRAVNKKTNTYKLIKKITKNTKISFIDKTTKKNRQYFYKICAYTKNGNVNTNGAYSKIVRVKKAK